MPGVRRVLGYARVSSAEQALGTSLQDQQDVIRAHAQKGGLSVARFYVEAESAVHEKIERREQIRALLAEARAGDLVLVDKVDRWSRDPEFTYRSMRELRERGARVYFVGDACDPHTPEGDTMLGMRALFAREEHKRIRVRTVGTRRLLRDKGFYVEGTPPWGYRRQSVKGLERNVLVVEPREAALVRDTFRLCARGLPVRAIAAELGVGTDRVKDALHRRLYLGEIRDSSGRWIRGKHPALVDARLFARAHEALEGRRLGDRGPRRGAQTDAWWLRTVARCICGARMAAAYAGPIDARRHYLHCVRACGQPYVRVDVAEAACEPLVLERLGELRDQLSVASDPPPRLRVDAQDLGARRAKLAARRERYLELYADGEIDREGLRGRLDRLDAERTRLDADEQAPVAPDPAERRRALAELRVMRHAWKRAEPRQRRLIVAALARSVALARGRAPRFDWYAAEELVARG